MKLQKYQNWATRKMEKEKHTVTLEDVMITLTGLAILITPIVAYERLHQKSEPVYYQQSYTNTNSTNHFYHRIR